MLANVQRLAHRGLAAARGRAASEDEDRTPRYAARAADGGDADPVARRGQVWASRPRTGPLVIDLDLFEGARRLLAADEVNAAVPRCGADTTPGCRRVGEFFPAIGLRQITLERPEVRRERETPARDGADPTLEFDRPKMISRRRDRRKGAPAAGRDVVLVRRRDETRTIGTADDVDLRIDRDCRAGRPRRRHRCDLRPSTGRHVQAERSRGRTAGVPAEHIDALVSTGLDPEDRRGHSVIDTVGQVRDAIPATGHGVVALDA